MICFIYVVLMRYVQYTYMYSMLHCTLVTAATHTHTHTHSLSLSPRLFSGIVLCFGIMAGLLFVAACKCCLHVCHMRVTSKESNWIY